MDKPTSRPEEDQNVKYNVATVYDEACGKITSTLYVENTFGSVGEKLQLIQHQMMDLREKGIQAALRKLGWIDPDTFKQVTAQYQKELDALNAALAEARTAKDK